ncbi:hypothetical protein AYO45_03420 [Gammaproteobacteria bacterium SCGC AG-212-F23]|nr:hypothetical protein AYO45_03420 [Gammaproteobacteria bacterium SCGC AG-212-F23]
MGKNIFGKHHKKRHKKHHKKHYPSAAKKSSTASMLEKACTDVVLSNIVTNFERREGACLSSVNRFFHREIQINNPNIGVPETFYASYDYLANQQVRIMINRAELDSKRTVENLKIAVKKAKTINTAKRNQDNSKYYDNFSINAALVFLCVFVLMYNAVPLAENLEVHQQNILHRAVILLKWLVDKMSFSVHPIVGIVAGPSILGVFSRTILPYIHNPGFAITKKEEAIFAALNNTIEMGERTAEIQPVTVRKKSK